MLVQADLQVYNKLLSIQSSGLWEVNVAVAVKRKACCNLLLLCPPQDPFIGDKSHEQNPAQGISVPQ